MSTIFSKIITREIPSFPVYEDDICIVIMDKFPAVAGQTLVISKKEVNYIFDLPEEDYAHMLTVAKLISQASDIAFSTTRTCLVIEGFEVPHAHIRLYPMKTADENLGITITNTAEASDEDLQDAANKIKDAL